MQQILHNTPGSANDNPGRTRHRHGWWWKRPIVNRAVRTGSTVGPFLKASLLGFVCTYVFIFPGTWFRLGLSLLGGDWVWGSRVIRCSFIQSVLWYAQINYIITECNIGVWHRKLSVSRGHAALAVLLGKRHASHNMHPTLTPSRSKSHHQSYRCLGWQPVLFDIFNHASNSIDATRPIC